LQLKVWGRFAQSAAPLFLAHRDANKTFRIYKEDDVEP
jgi:hypothetical protein